VLLALTVHLMETVSFPKLDLLDVNIGDDSDTGRFARGGI
jgi:hypothetical protein